MVSLFYARHYPAGRGVNSSDKPVSNDTPVSDTNGPSSMSVNDSQPRDVPPADSVPASSNNPILGRELANRDQPLSSTPTPSPSPSPSPEQSTPTQTDYFIPSSALNDPQPTTTQTLGTDTTPVSSSTIASTLNLPASSTVSLSTAALQSTPSAVLTQGETLSTDSSSHRKYIIGGMVGGGVLALILLALLLFCCRKRRAKGDLEHPDGGYSEGKLGYGQFACCNHGICNRNVGQPQMEQRSPLKPFIVESDSAALTPEDQQQHTISSERRDSTENHRSVGSDKRPPPLKLSSLVTPVINGPQNNPRCGVYRLSLPNLHGVPRTIVGPPQSATPDGMRRH